MGSPGSPDEKPLNCKNGKKGERRILGLSVGMFWGIVVLLCVSLAGGIGGGVGAGLASQESACSR